MTARIAVGLAVGVLALFASSLGAQEGAGKKVRVYIGTYTGKSKGIYRSELDLATGKLSEPVLAAEVKSPSFLAIHPDGKHLYCVNESGDFEYGGKKTGAITAFSLDPATGALKQLNQQGSGGAGPCHLTVDRTGSCVLAANYGGGSVCSLPLDKDGSLKPAASVIQHKGSSVDKSRQEGPHGHSINTSPDNRFAFAADLGLDKVLSYRLDAQAGKLTPNDPPAVELNPGDGPRHFAFHPDGKAAYVINELSCTITTLPYDARTGTLTKGKSVTTLPDKLQKGYSTAEVVVHPSGKFVYGSNRGQNSIAIFTVGPSTHELTPAGHQGKGVKTPRNFSIDPSGQYMLVANQDGHDVLVWRIDQKTGALTPTENSIQVAAPVCVRMLLVR